MIDADYIKEFLQDHPDRNILLDYVDQFGEDLIDMVIPMTYDYAKSMYASISNAHDIPDTIIVYGVISKLMLSESFVQLRNQTSYSDSNSSVSISDKESLYERKAAMMDQNFNMMLSNYVQSKFMQEAWGANSSNSKNTTADMLHYGTNGYRI